MATFLMQPVLFPGTDVMAARHWNIKVLILNVKKKKKKGAPQQKPAQLLCVCACVSEDETKVLFCHQGEL